jgi:hypothetical protein
MFLLFFFLGVGEKEFAAWTDAYGLVGGIARLTNRVPYILPSSGPALQIAGIWEDDLKPGKPIRQVRTLF